MALCTYPAPNPNPKKSAVTTSPLLYRCMHVAPLTPPTPSRGPAHVLQVHTGCKVSRPADIATRQNICTRRPLSWHRCRCGPIYRLWQQLGHSSSTSDTGIATVAMIRGRGRLALTKLMRSSPQQPDSGAKHSTGASNTYCRPGSKAGVLNTFFCTAYSSTSAVKTNFTLRIVFWLVFTTCTDTCRN